jgi:hypothetical protein
LITLLNFELDSPLELDRLWLFLNSEHDHMPLLLSFEVDQVLILLTQLITTPLELRTSTIIIFELGC